MLPDFSDSAAIRPIARAAQRRIRTTRGFRFALGLALAACMLAATAHAQAQTARPQTGARTVPVEGARGGPGSCTITIAALAGGGPNLINGGAFQYSVQFAPLSVAYTSRLIFDWPSTLEGFDQQTVRTEKFATPDPGTSVSGFFDVEIAPSATAISGTYTVKLVVTTDSDSGPRLFCTAAAQGNVGF